VADGGESLRTLDGTDRSLAAGDVVIADAHGVVSLAGVMGGERTEVRAQTTRILLEGAVWEPSAVRRTSRRLGLASEASARFERRVDPAGAQEAVARAAHLLGVTAGAHVTATTSVERSGAPWLARTEVVADASRIRALLALDLGTTIQAGLLRRSGSDVQVAGDLLTVTAPTWRGDLGRAADLAEEIARLHGFEHIPAELPPLVVRGGRTSAQQVELELRSAVLAAGFDEVVTRPFVGDRTLLGVHPSDGRVGLANPLAKDAAAMRPSLLDGLLATLRRNRGQGRAGMAIAELGRIHRPVDDALGAALDGLLGTTWRWSGPDGQALPLQPRALGIAAYGARLGPGWLDESDGWTVVDVLAVLDEVARRAGVSTLERQPVDRPGWHPGRSVVLLLDGVEIGIAGQLHPHEADHWDLPEPVVAGELLTEALLHRCATGARAEVRAPDLVRHPAVVVDVAVVAHEDLPASRIARTIQDAAGGLLDEMWLFDEFRGEQLPAEHRSLAYRLRLQDPGRQLNDQDADVVLSAVSAAVEAIGAALRH